MHGWWHIQHTKKSGQLCKANAIHSSSRNKAAVDVKASKDTPTLLWCHARIDNISTTSALHSQLARCALSRRLVFADLILQKQKKNTLEKEYKCILWFWKEGMISQAEKNTCMKRKQHRHLPVLRSLHTETVQTAGSSCEGWWSYSSVRSSACSLCHCFLTIHIGEPTQHRPPMKQEHFPPVRLSDRRWYFATLRLSA